MTATTLHIVARSPWSDPAFAQCLRVLQPGDALLLCGDGVFAALPGTETGSELARCAATIAVRVLDEDCALRGISTLPAGVAPLDYAGFVALACAHARSVSWF